ncbi:MAG: RtcB family protein, partial [Clostridiales bacterium]|nr:RtcB family protein [Clostridiales bacterium]
HGAGRELSRRQAKRDYPVKQVMADLKRQGVILGKRRLRDVAEEYRKAYKDIESVMEDQKDLAEPIKRLKTVAVIKG